MAENSAYAILGLQKGANDQDIKQAYLNLVKKFDPEMHTDRFMVIKHAYERLRDPQKRAHEDLLTYNVIRGDLLFNDDERPGEGDVPDDDEIASARERYRSMSGDPGARDNYMRLLMRRSCVYARRKKWVEAIEDWQEIHEIDPSHVRARNNLLSALVSLGTSYALHSLEEDAIELWERALQMNPDNVELIHNLALACEKCSRGRDAARYWAEVINRWKTRLKQEEDNDYLRECIIEAHRHHGASPTLSGQENNNAPAADGSAPAQPRVNPQVQERYREVLELKPDDFEARYQLAQSYLEERKYPEAMKELTDLQQKHPRNVEVLNLMAWAQLNSGQVDNAFNTWNRSLSIDKNNQATKENIVRAHLTLGKQYREKGMFTPALMHLKKLLRYMPKSAEVYMEIAATYDMQGDTRGAIQHYQQVLALDPKNKLARKALNDLRLRR